MNSRFTIKPLAIAIGATAALSATLAQGNSFFVDGAVANAMGGAGIANSDANNYQSNPALLINNQDDKFALTLPSVGVLIEDSNGFGDSVMNFVENDLDQYENLDPSGLATSMTTLTDAISALTTAQGDYDTTPNSTTLAAVQTANADVTAAIVGVSSETASIDSVVESTESTFNKLSNKPVQTGLLGNLGLAVPNIGIPFAVQFSNNTFIGAQLDLAPQDLAVLSDTIDDANEYLGLVADVSAANDDALATAAEMQVIYDQIDLLDPLDPVDAAQIALLSADLIPLETQLTADLLAVTSATTILTTTSTTNNVFVNGDFIPPTFDETSLTSSIQISVVNVTELGLASAYELNLGGEDFVAGLKLKFQQIEAVTAAPVFGDVATDAQAEVDKILNDGRKSHTVFNADLGVTKDFATNSFGTITAAAVVKDLIPYSLDTPSGDKISIKPQLRVGVAHHTEWSTLVADLDVTRNSAMGFGGKTQYLNLGAEVSLKGHAQARIGLKNNLAVSGDRAVTLGLGLTPFGVGVDISGWFTPGDTDLEMIKNAGVVTQFTMRF
jgi:hypothetical protein